MKLSWFFQLLIIIGFLLLGYSSVAAFHLPLPESDAGMLLLFLFLLTGVIKLD
ncbi:hypothetical protein [Neobacillus terrae]|uniref:hypothetical protein n=1 Tax=Neobacillus terrae TaxID=3034837 RepID=UPI001408CB60|nr:hypothetical protein [Neobacillus terrae]NHM32861.1 hypothetical protein [Neobacillus terrae]